MITEAQLADMVKEAKTATKAKKFKQSVELIVNFKDIDVKKGFALNEVVQLPKTSSPATVCVIATGDMGTKAKAAKADSVIGNEELDKFGANKRESRKFINKYDFFLADTQIMPTVGKTLGQLLGPRGKMPTPVPFNAPIEAFTAKSASSIVSSPILHETESEALVLTLIDDLNLAKNDSIGALNGTGVGIFPLGPNS